MIKTRQKKQPDYVLIALFAILVVFGLVMLSSAGTALGYHKFDDPYYFFKHQFLFGLIPGLIFLFIFSKIDYRKWKKISFPLLIFSIILLLLVFIPGLGASYGKAKSWINIGGFSLQPSEIVKLTFLIYLAAWLDKRSKEEIKDVSSGLVPFLILLLAVALLIILQPDIGTMSIIILVSLTVFFIAGADILHLIGIGAFGLFGLFLLIKAAPYRAARFTTFLHPELDPQGIGYHINQALLAIGSGGLFGLGLGHSRQKFQYLPEVTGDSIFAVIAEELGFFLTAGLIILFLALLYRGFKLAQRTPDKFSKLMVAGIISWFIIQALINIAAMLGLLPMTGIPLPFISYGGTALMTSLAAVGILINISKHSQI